MHAEDKHYKFINSKTGYANFYHTLKGNTGMEEGKAELEKVRAQVAIQNTISLDTVYWEEIKEEADNKIA